MTGRRLLKRYLKDSGQGVIALSKLSGFNDATVYRWLHGKRRPDIDSAAKLERITGGAVPASSWVHAA